MTRGEDLPDSPAERLFVWLGGAAFVASLLLCAYLYAIGWSTPASRQPSWRVAAWNAVLFVAFGAHHSIFARERVKRWMAGAVPDRLNRSVYVWVASLLFIAWLLLWRPVGGSVYRVSGLPALGLAAVQLAGVGLIAWSVRAIDALDLAGIRAAPAPGRLQVTGPYHLVRHPLYLGWVLVVFGAAHMTGNRLAFAAITSAYLLLAVPWEERSLEQTFGGDYARYRQAVRWRIIPFLY